MRIYFILFIRVPGAKFPYIWISKYLKVLAAEQPSSRAASQPASRAAEQLRD